MKLFVDPISVRYLKGAEVDFVDTVTGGGFTIKNPNATSTCGCGSSFSVVDGQGTRSALDGPTEHASPIAPDVSTACGPPAASAPASATCIVNVFLRRKDISAPTTSSI